MTLQPESFWVYLLILFFGVAAGYAIAGIAFAGAAW